MIEHKKTSKIEFFCVFVRKISTQKIKKEQKMENNNNHAASAELMQAVYKNAKMGSEAIVNIIGKTKDAKLRQELTDQLESYHGFECAAKNKLGEMSKEAKAPGVLSKLPADISIKMSTLMDSSNSKIAELMINGYNMGIVDIRKSMNKAAEEGVPEDVMNIANGIMSFEEGSAEKMKTYL